jgi:hypothetical protein
MYSTAMGTYVPQLGQLVQVTLLQDLWGGTGHDTVLMTPAGTVFEGIVVETADAWFTITTGSHKIRFDSHDESITITIILYPPYQPN